MPELAGIPLWIWGAFLAFVLGLLALDLGVFHREAHEVKMKEALGWSAVWIAIALLFAAIIYNFWPQIQPHSTISAATATQEYLAGYLIEKALSVDNIFVFLLVFTFFNVPAKYQHRVLFWGIIGALIFRAIFIALGAAILERFAWSMILFGGFLVFTGVKMLRHDSEEMDVGKNPVIKWVSRIWPVTPDFVGQSFFTKIDGRTWATPLFVTLMVVEFTDILFAVDSIPAIFAVTREPFIVFTSNVFAILGLRALFFAVSGLVRLFHYLKFGLSFILVFVGLKMLYGYVEKEVAKDWPHFPIGISLTIIGAILALSIVASLARPPSPNPETPHSEEPSPDQSDDATPENTPR